MTAEPAPEIAPGAREAKPPRPPSLWKRMAMRGAIEVGAVALRLLALTWRIRDDQTLHWESRARGRPVVGTFWHGRIIVYVWTWRNIEARTLVSQHADGDVMAEVARRFGFVPIRGSSSRGGREALARIVEDLGERDLGITPDGPRGPRYVCQHGFVECASAARRPVILGTWSCDRAWVLPTWDRAVIPKPFARVEVRYEQHEVAPDLDPAGRAKVKDALEARLKQMTRELDRRFGWPEDPALSDDPEIVRRCHEDEARARQERRAGRARRPRPLRVFAGALAGWALGLLLSAAAIRGGAAPSARADLAGALILATAGAALAGPALSLLYGLAAELGALAGTLLGALILARGETPSLLPLALAGALYPALVLRGGGRLARLGPDGPRTALLAAVPGALLLGSLFLVGPLLGGASAPGPALALLLHASPVTALSGSLLDLDLLRAAPLYRLLPVVSETPFAYPSFARTLLAPLAILIVATVLAARKGPR